MENQTAVEYLFEQIKMTLEYHEYIWIKGLCDEALKIEKQQIVDAYLSDRMPCSEQDAEEYYAKTFNKS